MLAQQNRWPTQPTWLGLTSRLGSGSTDPARPLSRLFPSHPRARWRSRSPPPSSGRSGRPRQPLPPPLGQDASLHLLYRHLQLEPTGSSPPRRSGWFSSRDPPPPIASGPELLPASSSLLAAHPLVLEMCCTRRWKTSLDRIQPAARALLRHAVWTSVWAQGEFLLLLLPHPLLLSLAMVSDHLVKTHEPSSPSWLSDTADDSGYTVIWIQ
jgi:hypothetical protein